MDKIHYRLRECSLLFADDDPLFREETEQLLRYLFREVYVARDGGEALALYRQVRPDILLIDILMPVLNGIDVVKQIRVEDAHTPIVMLTGHSSEAVLLEAARLYLEDYLLKPFDSKRLIEAFGRCIRRIEQLLPARVRLISGTEYELETHEVWRDGRKLRLGAKESRLLHLLVRAHPRVVAKSTIEADIWDHDMTESAYRNLVNKLRRKLGQESIQTLPGVGIKVILQ
ncbi:MAG: response regulator transcription factor [Pseudomonadota bacterium]